MFANALQAAGECVAVRLVGVEKVNEVTGKFTRKLPRKGMKPGDLGYNGSLNKMMDNCERLGHSPFIEYEAKLPDDGKK